MGCCRRMSEAEKVALPECRANLRRNHPQNRMERCCVSFKSNAKFLLILGAVIIGVVLGYFLREVGPFRNPAQNRRTMLYFTFAAEVMTRILRFISLPVTISGIVSGIANLNTKISVKAGVIIGLYFIATSILATSEGFLWIYVLNPGSNQGNNATAQTQPERYDFYYPDVLLDLVRNVFPDNFVTVAFETYHTSFSWKEIQPAGFNNETTFIESFDLAPTRRPNLLGVTVWVCLFGVFLTYLGSKKTKPLAEVLDSVYTVTSHMYRAFLWFYPVAVVLLVARLTLEMVDPVAALRLVSRFLLSVVVGEAAHFIVVLPLIYWAFTRRNPLTFFCSVSRALVMALASSDSSLALPVTLGCLDRNARVNSHISRYTLPLGVVFNKDGAAIYQVMVVVFFAKYRGIDPGVWDLFIMGCVSLALSFGASHIRDGMIIYAVLFHTLQLPVQDLVLLFPVHWILERVRVVVSVWSDCVGAAVADKLTRGEQELLNYRNSQYRLLKYDMMDTVKEADYV